MKSSKKEIVSAVAGCLIAVLIPLLLIGSIFLFSALVYSAFSDFAIMRFSFSRDSTVFDTSLSAISVISLVA